VVSDVAGRQTFGRIAVIGLGLIGGSLARLAYDAGLDVVGQDTDPLVIAAAQAAGLTATDTIADAVTGADLVVLAVPLRAMRATAALVARHLAPDATVTDIGSVKAPVRQAVVAAGLVRQYVGAHPMAGTQHSGFSASSAGLLAAATWVVTMPGDPARAEVLLRLVTGPLQGTALVLTDDVHDECAALISHVPHVAATQLLNAVAHAPVRDVALRMAAGSFRDGTRVALTDPARTEAMVVDNAAWVVPVLRKAVRDLTALIEQLEANAPVHDFFHAADAVRSPASGRAPTAPVALVPGWPGVLLERCLAGAIVVGLTDTDICLEL
jgi:prephenate dehydrogenase